MTRVEELKQSQNLNIWENRAELRDRERKKEESRNLVSDIAWYRCTLSPKHWLSPLLVQPAEQVSKIVSRQFPGVPPAATRSKKKLLNALHWLRPPNASFVLFDSLYEHQQLHTHKTLHQFNGETGLETSGLWARRNQYYSNVPCTESGHVQNS